MPSPARRSRWPPRRRSARGSTAARCTPPPTPRPRGTAAAERLVGRLLGQGERVVHGRGHAPFGQRGAPGVAVGRPHDAEVVHVPGVVGVPRRARGRRRGRRRRRSRRRSLPAARSGSTSRSHAASSSDSRKFCDTSVCTYCAGHAVHAPAPHGGGELVVVGHERAAVADAAHVLRRVEAVRRGDAADAVQGAVGLGRVLQHRHAEVGQRRRPAVQVDRHDRLRPVGDRRGAPRRGRWRRWPGRRRPAPAPRRGRTPPMPSAPR